MNGVQEVAWVGLAVSALAALQGLAPDREGSPSAPLLAVMMTAVAALIVIWLVLDRRHHHS